MAVRIFKGGNADFQMALDSLSNGAIAERLDVMDAWQYLFLVDPKGLDRKELTEVAMQMFEDVDVQSRPSFVEAFRGGMDSFRRYMDDYRRSENRKAAVTRQEKREARLGASPRKFSKTGLSV